MISADHLLRLHGASVRARDKTLKRQDQKRRRHERLRAYSFLSTLAIIAIVIVASYASSLPQVGHIPDKFEFNPQAWMTCVPDQVESAIYVDYDGAYSLSGTTQFFGSSALLYLPQLNFTIFPLGVSGELDMELPSADYNGTVTVMKPHDQQLKALQSATATSTGVSRFAYQGYDVLELLIGKASDQRLQGYLSIVDGYVIFSYDRLAGKKNVERILDQFAFEAPTLFDNAAVRAGVYAAGGTDQHYIGLQVGMFQTQLNQSRMIVKAIVQDGTGILVTRSILFPSSDIAVSQYGEAHRVYRDATSYKILDSWLVVAYKYPVDRLGIEVSGI